MAGQKQIVDLSKLLEPYEGKWVAISGDKSRVLCAANTMEEVLQKSQDYKDEEPILIKVPDEYTPHLL